ncbi:unnamed protein product [Didymodactylos carnosus]|uniref:Uncharacterized protein n=1 Tax=Didymodactylos carnosus TaxID=1234261 RepID=A0A8S2KH67_9BILA|nr:unnamed protein product [Didymodactylos carnosus]CAF3844916.1 unnamed protein product [Didymodactylos carnosus]
MDYHLLYSLLAAVILSLFIKEPSIIEATSQRRFEWSSSYHKHSYSDLTGSVRELLSALDDVDHNHDAQKFNNNKELLFEEFRLANSDTSSKTTPRLSSKQDQQRQKLARQMLFDAGATVDGSGETTLFTSAETLFSTSVVQTSTLSERQTIQSTIESTILSTASSRETSTNEPENTTSTYISISSIQISTLSESATATSISEISTPSGVSLEQTGSTVPNLTTTLVSNTATSTSFMSYVSSLITAQTSSAISTGSARTEQISSISSEATLTSILPSTTSTTPILSFSTYAISSLSSEERTQETFTIITNSSLTSSLSTSFLVNTSTLPVTSISSYSTELVVPTVISESSESLSSSIPISTISTQSTNETSFSFTTPTSISIVSAETSQSITAESTATFTSSSSSIIQSSISTSQPLVTSTTTVSGTFNSTITASTSISTQGTSMTSSATTAVPLCEFTDWSPSPEGCNSTCGYAVRNLTRSCVGLNCGACDSSNNIMTEQCIGLPDCSAQSCGSLSNSLMKIIQIDWKNLSYPTTAITQQQNNITFTTYIINAYDLFVSRPVLRAYLAFDYTNFNVTSDTSVIKPFIGFRTESNSVLILTDPSSRALSGFVANKTIAGMYVGGRFLSDCEYNYWSETQKIQQNQLSNLNDDMYGYVIENLYERNYGLICFGPISQATIWLNGWTELYSQTCCYNRYTTSLITSGLFAGSVLRDIFSIRQRNVYQNRLKFKDSCCLTNDWSTCQLYYALRPPSTCIYSAGWRFDVWSGDGKNFNISVSYNSGLLNIPQPVVGMTYSYYSDQNNTNTTQPFSIIQSTQAYSNPTTTFPKLTLTLWSS